MKTKTSTTKAKITKRTLVCAEGGQCFWTCDGKVLSDLTELRDTLLSMTDQAFSHHVTKEKNDFADWIESILLDSKLAADIRKAKKVASARTAVIRALKEYDL